MLMMRAPFVCNKLDIWINHASITTYCCKWIKILFGKFSFWISPIKRHTHWEQMKNDPMRVPDARHSQETRRTQNWSRSESILIHSHTIIFETLRPQGMAHPTETSRKEIIEWTKYLDANHRKTDTMIIRTHRSGGDPQCEDVGWTRQQPKGAPAKGTNPRGEINNALDEATINNTTNFTAKEKCHDKMEEKHTGLGQKP